MAQVLTASQIHGAIICYIAREIYHCQHKCAKYARAGFTQPELVWDLGWGIWTCWIQALQKFHDYRSFLSSRYVGSNFTNSAISTGLVKSWVRF